MTSQIDRDEPEGMYHSISGPCQSYDEKNGGAPIYESIEHPTMSFQHQNTGLHCNILEYHFSYFLIRAGFELKHQQRTLFMLIKTIFFFYHFHFIFHMSLNITLECKTETDSHLCIKSIQKTERSKF